MSDLDPDRSSLVAGYLAGGDDAGISKAERARLDGLRRTLADEAIWASPPPELVDRIVAELGDAAPGRGRHRWAKPLLVVSAAAAVAVVLGVLVGRDSAGTGDQVALAGTELAPGATATAELRATPSGVSITLETDGLDPAPAGFYYQAWVAGPRGTVAIGTFHLRDGDDEAVELWSGVDLADYPALTVTLEPEDGDPASSGQRVLASG